MKTILIESVQHLTRLATEGNGVEIFIRLSGAMRSSKFISFNGTRFFILHQVDGAQQFLRPKALDQAGLLLEAISTGNCFAEFP